MNHKWAILEVLILVSCLSATQVSANVTACIADRHETYIELNVSPLHPRAGDTLNISIVVLDARTGEPIIGSPFVTLTFNRWYKEWGGVYQAPVTEHFPPGGTEPKNLTRHTVFIVASYNGTSPVLGQECGVAFYQQAKTQKIVPVAYVGALAWLMNHWAALLTIFFVLIGYRWFQQGKLNFDELLAESGIYDILQDLLGRRR